MGGAAEASDTAPGATAGLAPDGRVAREAQARRARLRFQLALALLASAVVLTAIGSWTYRSVERSLRASRAAALRSVLDAQAKTIEIWIEDQVVGAARLARDAQVQAQVRALAAIAARPGVTPEQYCAAPERRPLVEQLDEALAGTGTVGFNLVDRSGRIIASKFREYCGLRIAAPVRETGLETVFRGGARFLRPLVDAGRLEQPPARSPLERPLVWVETPVRDASGGVVAALGVAQYAHAQFAAIFAAARAGESDEVFAFSREGVMLSESRFSEALEAAGRLPAGRGAMLEFVMRPPGAGPGGLTRLVEDAREGLDAGRDTGMLSAPYPGYLGQEVVGGWRWLRQYDIGIGIELRAGEAYAALGVLRATFGAVFGALVIAVLAALYAWFAAARLRGELAHPRVGAYLLGERIGQGGVGNVYLARHDLLKRPTAVKLLKAHRATDEMTARFAREAQLASQLSHPNMVEIFDYGRSADGNLYYAMEFLEGETIGQILLREGAMPVARVLHLLRQVCAGLAEAHGKGMVHRDISATNIMVCRYGGEYDFVKILDFGLVKRVAQAQTRTETITRSMRLLGTPLYMAPERLRNPADVDARADIYAVGAIAFFALTGRRMFDTNDELAMTSMILNDAVPAVSSVAQQPIPPELDALVAACVQKRREDRPARIVDVLEQLERMAQAARWTQKDAEAAWRAAQGHASGAPA